MRGGGEKANDAFRRAVAAHKADRYREARALYGAALTTGAASAAHVLGNLSALAFVKRNFAAAEALARKAADADASRSNAYIALGLALKAQRRLEEAVDAFGACVEREPRH